MKSGEPGRGIHEEPFLAAIADIRDHAFVQQVFHPRPALLAKESVNGHRRSMEFKGGAFGPAKCDLVEGRWDHEHCGICRFTIRDGHTYWMNQGGVKLLCDACHDEYAKRRAK